MKKSAIFFLLCFLCFYSCNQRNKKKEIINNGISHQLLKAVDSIPYCVTKENFITIWFTMDTLGNPIIRIKNCLLEPALPEPIKLHREPLILISQWKDFIGYKRYKNRILVFIKGSSNSKYYNFINKDSLKSNEIPFKEYKVYTSQPKRIHENIEKVLRIFGKDSLILLNKTNDNVYR
jgi:hypothetical protein